MRVNDGGVSSGRQVIVHLSRDFLSVVAAAG